MEQYLTQELEQRATSLAGILEASSRNAIASQAAAERILAQRLLDNARFIDFNIGRSPRGEELIGQIVAENQLAKVEVLDLEGNPLALGSLVPAGPAAGGLAMVCGWAGARIRAPRLDPGRRCMGGGVRPTRHRRQSRNPVR